MLFPSDENEEEEFERMVHEQMIKNRNHFLNEVNLLRPSFINLLKHKLEFYTRFCDIDKARECEELLELYTNHYTEFYFTELTISEILKFQMKMSELIAKFATDMSFFDNRN